MAVLTQPTKKTQILEAAVSLIQTRGFQSTSIEEILEACGCGKSQFYYYFKNKEELGLLILEQYAEQKIKAMNELAADRTQPADQRLFSLFYRIRDNVEAARCHGGCLMGNMAIELSDVHEEFRQRIA